MLQNFLKIYPKSMSAQRVDGAVLVQLAYAVEQYGVFTGPFDMVVRWQPPVQAPQRACWTIVSNTHQRDRGAFEGFFKTLESYLRDQTHSDPLEEVRSGVKKSFEMYFPEMHCELYQKTFGAEAPEASGDKGWASTLSKAVSSLGLGLAH